MAIEISEAERERRRLVAKLMGRFFPNDTDLPRTIIYSHGDRPRLAVAALPKDRELPLRSDEAFVILPSRTTLKAGPSQ